MTWQRFPFFSYLAAKDTLSRAVSPFLPRRQQVWDEAIEAGKKEIIELLRQHGATGKKP